MREDTEIKIKGEEYLNLLLVAKHAKGLVNELERVIDHAYLMKSTSKNLKESLKRLE